MYKIAVYAICKNELQFVSKWINSMSEADYICVLDTGSTDGTYEALCEYQMKEPNKYIIQQKTITPWRFDTARNESMKLIPKDADFCVCTDLDEILIPGWANDFRNNWEPHLNRMYYLYAWSHHADGSNDRIFWYDKCHDNSGDYYWAAPVHEYLTRHSLDNQDNQYEQGKSMPNNIYLHHYPDMNKSRASYLPLLELRQQESPDDYLGKVYLAHEYYYQNHYQKCIDYIINNIFPIIDDIDPYNCKMDLEKFIGKAYIALGQNDLAKQHFYNSIDLKPDIRDCYLLLGETYIDEGQYEEAINIINKGLLKGRRQYSWLDDGNVWGSKPADLLSLAYYYSGAKYTSLRYAELAYAIDPMNQRLKENYELIKAEVEKNEENQ